MRLDKQKIKMFVVNQNYKLVARQYYFIQNYSIQNHSLLNKQEGKISSELFNL